MDSIDFVLRFNSLLTRSIGFVVLSERHNDFSLPIRLKHNGWLFYGEQHHIAFHWPIQPQNKSIMNAYPKSPCEVLG